MALHDAYQALAKTCLFATLPGMLFWQRGRAWANHCSEKEEIMIFRMMLPCGCCQESPRLDCQGALLKRMYSCKNANGSSCKSWPQLDQIRTGLQHEITICIVSQQRRLYHCQRFKRGKPQPKDLNLQAWKSESRVFQLVLTESVTVTTVTTVLNGTLK
jgi:hypothetical protein